LTIDMRAGFRYLKAQSTTNTMNWLLEARHVSKSFAGVRVLEEVSLQLRPGEVQALIGENGAGKSTLMKILAGVEYPDTGTVSIDGHIVPPGNPHLALKAGIGMIFQELLPFPELSVAENVLMGQQPVSRWLRSIDHHEMHRRAAQLLARLQAPIPTTRRMRDLGVAESQLVEIAKALSHRVRVLIMDEPTSALTEHEVEGLNKVIRDLRSDGTAVVYISHKLDEIFRLADRISVLRDGRMVACGDVGEFTTARLISLMVGRDQAETAVPKTANLGPEALAVDRLSKRNCFKDVSFRVRRGEVLGLAGLMGAGRTEIVNAIYGLEPPDSGTIAVAGCCVEIQTPGDALRAGIGLVSEDRKLFGLVPTMTVGENLTLAALRRVCRGGAIVHRLEREAADNSVSTLGIRARTEVQSVDHLSGGNQQKVVLGRTLFAEPEILLLDEPTRGIDVQARSEVHLLIRELARSGKAVVLVSSEMPELLSLSDRILVIRQGAVAAELDARKTGAEEVLRFAMPESRG
jgi:inositol transport system ATP-binding protein